MKVNEYINFILQLLMLYYLLMAADRFNSNGLCGFVRALDIVGALDIIGALDIVGALDFDGALK